MLLRDLKSHLQLLLLLLNFLLLLLEQGEMRAIARHSLGLHLLRLLHLLHLLLNILPLRL